MATAALRSTGQTLPSDASALEYARHHGICRDYTTKNPLDPRYLPQPPIFLSQDLADPTGCLQPLAPQSRNTTERLDVDTPAVAELSSVLRLTQAPQADGRDSAPRCLRAFKLEPPMLNTDHELDALKFRLEFQKRDCLRLQDIALPLEHVDQDKDEGVSWPSWCQRLSSTFEDEIGSDRLDIPKEALLYLRSICAQPEKPNGPEIIHTKPRRAQPITPPLLPADPVFTHIPDPSSSSPTGQVQLLSEATDSTAAEAEALESKILQEDQIETPDAPGLKYITEDPMLFDDVEYVEIEQPAPPLRSRKLAAELKVETPLTPPSTLPSAFRSSMKTAKTVAFPKELLEYIHYPAELPSGYENGNAILDSENECDAFFQELVTPMAEKADRLAENEKLQEVDTTKRIEVPCIGLETLTAPWLTYSWKPSLKKNGITTELAAQRRLLSRCASEELAFAPKWHESLKEEMGMLWHPFRKGLQLTVATESIQYDAALDRMIGSSSLTGVDILDSGSLAWRTEGLRILDDTDNAEEISAWQFELEDDMTSLLRKRRLEIANSESKSYQQPTESTSKEASVSGSIKKQKLNETYVHRTSDNVGNFVFGGLFSTAGSLTQFMHIQTGAAIPEKSYTIMEPDSTAKLSETKENIDKQETAVPTISHPRDTTPTTLPVPTPPIPAILPPKPFIVSSTLLTRRRSLVRNIQYLYPAAKLVERDTGKHLSATLPPSADPDIMLSPATGLLITSLQRIKQRPLPGQPPAQSTALAFQTQVTQAASKFARLLVLVSEASATDSTPRPLDQRDCEALASLNGFAASIASSSVTVTYVPGGEAALARWIVSAMDVYGRCSADLLGGEVHAGKCALQDEEGLWELFLRRAGMNAFAAQVVLGRRKPGGGDKGYGLVEFVRMGKEERRQAFEDVLGGWMGLDEVGERVDRTWQRAKMG